MTRLARRCVWTAALALVGAMAARFGDDLYGRLSARPSPPAMAKVPAKASCAPPTYAVAPRPGCR